MPKVQVRVVGKSRVINGSFVTDNVPSQKTLEIERSALDQMTLASFMEALEGSVEYLEYQPTASLLKMNPCIVYYPNPHSRWLGCKVTFETYNLGSYMSAYRIQGFVIEQFKVHRLPSTTLQGKRAIFKSWPTSSYIRIVVNEKEDEKSIPRALAIGLHLLPPLEKKYLTLRTSSDTSDSQVRPVLFVSGRQQEENTRNYYETTIESRFVNSRDKDVNLAELAVSGVPELVNLARNPRVLSRQ